MAFRSHVLEDGQWVERTTNVADILRKKTVPVKPNQQVPQCGILTRTIVQSPVAHWVLPVRLRSSQHNDVAFVGDHYVQISELRRDGQLHNINRKYDFGSRIRNAKVVGSSRVMVNGEEYATTEPVDDTFDMSDPEPFLRTPSSSPGAPPLPPQLLLVVLETGDCVFLFLRPGDGDTTEFIALQHCVHSTRLVRPGFHLAVDPSSRFVAQACSKNMFVVHELESMHHLNDSYTRGLSLRPIVTSRPRTVNGVIHTMEFLFPRPQDPQHIILLLIVVKDGVSRIVTYDWELGDDLRRVLAEEKNGHVLPPQHEMPLMVIPLTVQSAFFAVSEGEVAYCADVLQGSPSFEPCEVHHAAPSEHHDGTDPPLWTAWSRPPRLYPYHRDKDFIYLAREDGVVIYLECDSDDILAASFYHGTFCNVSTAFASLADEFDDGEGLKNGESLVFGGDSGQGGVWRASPRTVITKLCRIPNWSPTPDFVTTARASRWDNVSGAGEDDFAAPPRALPDSYKPDKLYAIAGRASNGSIVEYRVGMQANIGIEFDFGVVIKRCFMFREDTHVLSGYHLLLSVPGRSAQLSFDSKFSSRSANDVEQSQTPYDLASPTLLAVEIDEGTILQVTERGMVFVQCMGSLTCSSTRFYFEEFGLGDAIATDAFTTDNALVIISHTDLDFHLHAIKLDIPNLGAEYLYSEPFPKGEVTSFSLSRRADRIYAVACVQVEKAIYLDFHCINDRRHVGTILVPEAREPFTSIVLVEESTSKTTVVAGSRDGFLVTMDFSAVDELDASPALLERIGSMPVHVYPARQSGSVFVCCGSDFILASRLGSERQRRFDQKHSVWTVDAEDSSKSSPAITSVTVLPKSLSGNDANIPLLLLANDRVLLAELQPQVGPVHRQIPLGMTPFKLLYSHVLKCLVVAAMTSRGKTTLRFIDPETGKDLSVPADGRTKEPVEFISGLGRENDRILCLEEWHVKSDSGNGHYFILVSTAGDAKGGCILIVSPRVDRSSSGQGRGNIRFWTRYKLKAQGDSAPGPISAVTTFDHKIQSSMGTRLLYHELDEIDRKITQGRTQELGGPAWKLSILPSGSRTLTLVKGDSLRVLEEGDGDQGPSVTHVEGTTRPVIDMIEVAGTWEEGARPVVSEPPRSIVLLSDQNCSLKGLWIPWDNPGQNFDAVFEADLPSSVRRLRLGRTRPPWSWDAAALGPRCFGRLPASIDGAEILGMGIDGSLQHFTLLDVNIWRFLRFLQNISETSADLYPFTYVPVDEFEGEEDDDDDMVGVGGFDPTPVLDNDHEMQVDGDLMLRCLEKRALEGLLGRRAEWMKMFMEYLDKVDSGRWTQQFHQSDEEEDVTMDEDLRRKWYFDLGYKILGYFLSPVI